ncbi:hypothetical protein TNCV_3879691 [Trichonephila clavipes]|nr:hypothetical protein TNCV_3879691 [Trichonephila clavipes]
MNDSDSDMDSVSGKTYKSRSSISSRSGNSTPSPTISNCERRRKLLADIELTDQTIAVYQQIVRPHDIHDPIVKGLAKAKRRRSTCIKQDSEGFVFPTKSARPTTPTPVLEPIPTQNNFENLEQEPEPMIDSIQENVSPIIKPPYPITLKTDKNYRDQLKKISENFPNISIKTAGDYIKLFPKTEEKGNLTKFLELDKNYQFYVTQAKLNKPLKVVLKGLPRVTLPEDIQIDLEALGYTIISCSQLISKRTKLELPFFLVTLL